MVCKTTGFWEFTYCSNHPRNRTTLTKHSNHYFPPTKCVAIRSPRKCYQNLLSGQGIFPSKKIASNCVAIWNFWKSQKMISKLLKVFKALLFPTQKTATKCVAIRNFSKSQKMFSKPTKWLRYYFSRKRQPQNVWQSKAFLVQENVIKTFKSI